jgi:ABC-type long-subunit fatty acid transport system fused permease/ATPase subunit
LVFTQVFNIKSGYGLSETDYDRIVGWVRNILSDRNRLKHNFYTAKSIMKFLGLGYQKIDICSNFCMSKLIGRWRSFVTHRKLRYFSITPRLQRLFISPNTVEHMTWHDINHMMRWMKWLCTISTVKPGKTLIVCILIF